jgi:hypothetical protein
VSRLGRGVGDLSGTAQHALQDYLLNGIAQLQLESQHTFSGDCCRCRGLSLLARRLSVEVVKKMSGYEDRVRGPGRLRIRCHLHELIELCSGLGTHATDRFNLIFLLKTFLLKTLDRFFVCGTEVACPFLLKNCCRICDSSPRMARVRSLAPTYDRISGAQHQGKQTASGTIYDQAGLTAAHRSLPFGSKIKVTNLANGKSVEVEITDRGPSAGNRIIDLSQAAAKALEMTESGTATVRLEQPSGH